MRIINLTNKVLSFPVKHLENIPTQTISREFKATKDLLTNMFVHTSNIFREKFVLICSEDERSAFNELGSVYPYLSLRDNKDLVEYQAGDEVPSGATLITDQYHVDPNGTISSVDLLILPGDSSDNTKPSWETPSSTENSKSKVRFIVLSRSEYTALPKKDENALYFIHDERIIYRGGVSYSKINSIEDLSEFVVTELRDLGMTNDTIVSSKAVVDYINHRFSTAISGVEYRGLIDPSNPTLNQYWTDAHHGYIFRVSTDGTLNGISLGLGDSVIINKDVTGEPTSADMDVIPYTLDEIGELKSLETENKTNLVSAINEINESLTSWDGIDK